MTSVLVFGQPHCFAGTVVVVSMTQSGVMHVLKAPQGVGFMLRVAVKHAFSVSVAVPHPVLQVVLPVGHFFG